MSDLGYTAKFIGARLAEWQALAQAATPGPWEPEHPFLSDFVTSALLGRVADCSVGTGYRPQSLPDARHIAAHDPASAQRLVTAIRSAVAACTRAAEADPNGPAGVLALAVAEALSTGWEHKDRPFVPDWTLRPGTLLREALAVKGIDPDDILGAEEIIAGTLRIDRMHAGWISDALGTTPDMWMNAQRIYDAAILRGATDTSEERGQDDPEAAT